MTSSPAAGVISEHVLSACQPGAAPGSYHLHQHAGLTLIEVLITIAILSTSLLALARLQINLLNANVLTRQRSTAAHFSRDRIEHLRLEIAGGMVPASGSDTLGPPLSGSDIELEGLSTTFSRHWALSTSSHSAHTQVLTVEVHWHDKTGRSHAIRLDTLLPSP